MKSRILRIAAVTTGAAAAFAAVYAGVGFLAVPAIVASQAEKMAQQQFKRKLAIDRVAFNPFKLTASLRGVRLLEPDGSAVFVSFDALDADLSWQSLRRLAPVVESVRLQAPYVHVVRGDNGQYNFDDILQWLAAQPPSPEPALFSVNNIELADGRIAFDDRPARAAHTVEGLHLGLPFISSMPADVDVYVEPLLSATIDGAPLRIQGKAKPYAQRREFAAELKLDKLELPQLLGYLPFKPAFKLPSARLDARLTASFVQPKAGGSSLALGGEAALSNVDVRDAGGAPVLKFARLSAQLDKLDVLAGRYAVAKVGLDGLDAVVQRDAQGSLNLERLLPPSSPAPAAPVKQEKTGSATLVAVREVAIRNAALRYGDATPYTALTAGVQRFNLDVRGIAVDTGKRTVAVAEAVSGGAALVYAQGARTAGPPAPASAAAAEGGQPYQVQVGKLDVKGWSLNVEDASRGQPLSLALSPLQLTVKGWSNAPASRSEIDFAATVNRGGKLGVSGSVAAAPLDADLALDLKNLDLQPLQPLIAEHVNLRVAQAAVSAKGHLTLADDGGAIRGGYKGDVSIDRLTTVDRLNDADFLSWKSLALGGMDVRLAPLAVNIGTVALSDFFARVIIDPNGRINVQDVMRTAANEDRSLTDAKNRAQDARKQAAAANASSAQGKLAQAPAGKDGKTVPAAAAPAAAPIPPVRIGQLRLSGGRVRFTDNFIKPNYTANLKDLGGVIAGLASDPSTLATVDIKGSVNSAPLAIAGKVHPLRKDLYLDLKADVRGMELAALSAYADKYVGYGIEKGKLSFEVAYRLEERKLSAENRLILDQLTFGGESTNPDATRLPVRMAVALLSDRNGVIDINVPVGGSLDDPQFSLGGIVMQVIGNAVMKTVTAPFTFIASLFGGNGEDMAALAFDAGLATVPAAREEKLAPLARALQERPGLKLDIGGRYDPATDTVALRQLALERRLRQMKLRDLQAQNRAAPEGGVTVTAEERPALLARAFAADPLPKPRNALGLQKSVAPADMEQALLAAIVIDGDDLTALAHRRAQAARDWLVKHGVPVERVFLTAVKEGGGRAEFSLR